MRSFSVMYVTAFNFAIFFAFLTTMIETDGRANMNTYGEGWGEVCLALIAFVILFFEWRKS